MRSFGITGEALGWIEAFLSNRKQKVRVNGSESQWAPVLSGIPQGSILGPILFSLFVNDLPGEVKGLISLFADDSKMYIPLSSDDSAIQLQEDLWMLENWANQGFPRVKKQGVANYFDLPPLKGWQIGMAGQK